MSYLASAQRILNHFNKSTEVGPVWLIKQVVRGGNNTPLNPGTKQEFRQCLTDPVFVSTIKDSEAGRTDIKFDRVLMAGSDEEIVVDDLIEFGGKKFVVKDTRIISGGNPVAYKLWLSVA